MWHTGLSSRVVNETKKKKGIKTNKLGPRNVLPNSIDIIEDKGKGEWAKGHADETRDREKPLQNKEKSIREMNEWTRSKSDTNLPAILQRYTSGSNARATGSSLRERPGQVGQLGGTAAFEQGA